MKQSRFLLVLIAWLLLCFGLALSPAFAQSPVSLCVPAFNSSTGVLSCVPVGQTSPNITTPNALPVGGVATVAAPTYVEGRSSPLSLDPSGNLRVSGSFIPSGSSPEFAPVAPGTATATVSVLNGCQYNSTQETLTNGQQAATSCSARGAFIVAPGADNFAVQATLAAETTKVIGTVNQGTSPWVVSGTFFQATQPISIASGQVASGAYSSGSFASGALSSGSVASGAFASGSIASGAIVDGGNVVEGATADAAATQGGTGTLSAKLRLVTTQFNTLNTTVALAANQTVTQAPVAPATATATKSDLIGCQATSVAITPTTGQQAAIDCDLNNNLLVSSGGAPNLATTQVSVATSDTSVAAARGLRRSITVQQVTGTQQVYCSQTTATSANGILLPAVVGSSFTLSTTSAIRCIALTGAQTVAVAETF